MTGSPNTTRIADAALRLAGIAGLDAVTFTRVAVEAGVSRGLVQHVFGTRAVLLRATSMRLRTRIDERITTHLTGVDTPAERLAALLGALVPATDEEIDEAYAAASLMVLTRHDAELAQAFRTGRRLLAEAVARCLRDAGTHADPGAGATVLLGLTGELRQAVVLGEIETDLALRQLRLAIHDAGCR